MADAVVELADAGDVHSCGGKAVALARAWAAGLPVLPGFVLPVGAGVRSRGGAAAVPGAVAAWERLSDGGTRPLVVRSSGVAEDGATSSLAGRFASIVGVRGWEHFVSAVDEVLASADGFEAGMAVLVQAYAPARHGGVLFGADPVSGDARRLVLCSAADGPAAVVGGTTLGAQYTLTRRGRVLALREGAGGARLEPSEIADLVRLAGATRRVFGSPQDIEWLHDEDGALWLLQSRPVTTLTPAGARRAGPLLGPGPVAETFPDRLAPLEVDLWVDPLRQGLTEALRLAGTVSHRALQASPVVVVVDGRVAVDLSLIEPARPRGVRRLDPRPPGRRLRAAWRVGRLRAALPSLARGVIEAVDRLLAEVPDLQQLPDDDLLRLMRRGREALAAVHGHEVLAGMLLVDPGASGRGLATALRLAADGRAAGLTDEEVVELYPTVLALVPPAVRARVSLPAELPAVPAPGSAPAEQAVLREALRLRTRWLQETGARAAYELGARLAARGLLGDWAEVRSATLDQLAATVRTALPLPPAPTGPSRPLPPAFRLTSSGVVVPAQRAAPGRARSRPGDGVASGGGQAEGVVHGGPDRPAEGAVLVVDTLSPSYAPWLPGLAGVVCETGSPLAHLAILAREYGVPTVLSVPDAVRRFPPGTRVRVDGRAGTVEVCAPVEAS